MMNQVLKFGGSSVANADNIRRVIDIVQKKKNQYSLVVIVSALGGTTDLLINAARKAAAGDESCFEDWKLLVSRHYDCMEALMGAQSDGVKKELDVFLQSLKNMLSGLLMLGELSPRALDKIAAFGELLSSVLISHAMNTLSHQVEWVDARELIVTNDSYGNAQVLFESTNLRIRERIADEQKIYVVPGFIAATQQGLTTTLGRGGSDYTASIFAAAIQASVLEIWTDVSGMMTADPRLCSNARIIQEISYQEAMELSHFGAKVIYPPTIQPVMQNQIPVWIKNTFAPNDYGTRITHEKKHDQKVIINDKHIITGISSIGKIALVTIQGSGMIGIAGFSKRFFEALSREDINVILITQSSSEHSITVAIDEKDMEKAEHSVLRMFEQEIAGLKVETPVIEKGMAIVAIVGDQMRNHTGVSGKMFHAMGKNGINIRAIAQGSSEMNISAVIHSNDVGKTIQILHEEFFETACKQIHLFVAGVGNVGKKLVTQLAKQSDFLQQQLNIQIRLAGIINSKKMVQDIHGINWEKWDTALSNGQTSNISIFISNIIRQNLPNTVFADVTANDQIADVYDLLLRRSIAVVACNKIAASSQYEKYISLKSIAREFNTRFLFETNVGAGLPVIGTINDLISSGDRIHKIEAVLSGTLNFVFNHYDGSRTFSEVVRQAQLEGYTEPDPRLDLGGKDVMRKILILAREAGYEMEMDDILNNGFMPEACMQGTVEDFYQAMTHHEAHFKKLFDEASNSGNKLKFVASFNKGHASVGLQQVSPDHNLYHLYGKDNVVLFYTDRYYDQPLVIKGAGAGADVTASGVFADILRATR